MGDEHDGSVELDEGLLEPLERVDVEMVGWLVEQQHFGARGERARERRARELAAGEAVECPVEVLGREAEAPRHNCGAVAPQVAAPGLQPRLRPRVAGERRFVGRAGRHDGLELGQVGLDLELLGAA